VLRIDTYNIARLRQEEMRRGAERGRLATRVYRPERETNDRRIDLRLRALRPLIAIRQA
jgi:hypothetical protein